MSNRFDSVALPDSYYIWLCDMIDLRSHSGYSRLTSFLSSTEFYWSVEKDINRAEDGRQLRIDWVVETGFNGDSYWIDQPCSVLEMLIALARRLRADIMPEYDQNLADWYWIFVTNLGLERYDDGHFSENEAGAKIDAFLSRKSANFLFICKKLSKRELLKTDIWRQMQFWLDENYDF